MKAVRTLLGALAVAAVLAVIRQLITGTSFESVPPEAPALILGAGLAASLSGLVVWQSRPQRSTGPLLTVAGFAILLGALGGLLPVQVDIIGSFAWACFPLVAGHALMAYPDGVPRRWRPAIVGSCWLVPAILGVALLLVADRWEPVRSIPYVPQSRRHLLLPFADHPDLARWLAIVYAGWVGVVSVVVAIATLVRANRSSPAMRPSVVPVAWAGALWSLSLLGSIPSLTSSYNLRKPPKIYQLLTVTGTVVPAMTAALVAGAIVWADVLRPRLDPARGGRIVLSGEALPVAEALRRRLAKVVGDPSLRLAILGPEGRWLAPNGKPVALRDDKERATTKLTRDGQVIAAVEYDHALRATPDLVMVATTMAGLAIDNVRLAALDVAQLEEMRNSGAALLAAADRARHRLAATIAQGPAAKLEELAVRAAQGVDQVELQRALRDIAVEVRAISHGVYPPELERAGLAAALDHAAEVPAERFSPAVELTAYLVAAGHAGARLVHDDGRLVITMTGAVPEDVAVRVEALDGTIVVDGEATTVSIPVAE